MLKRYTFWFSAAILFQFLTAVIHTIGMFFRSEPKNEIERQLLIAMRGYERDGVLGFTPSYSDLLTGWGASFTLLLLFAGLVNGYLLIKQTEPNVMRGVLAINVGVFAAGLLLMAIFTFSLPVVLFTGLIFINLVMAYLTAPKIEITI
jgi:hypothetical protein